jgi:hypothetical protein
VPCWVSPNLDSQAVRQKESLSPACSNLGQQWWPNLLNVHAFAFLSNSIPLGSSHQPSWKILFPGHCCHWDGHRNVIDNVNVNKSLSGTTGQASDRKPS